jgi:hypothetical protein
MPVYPGAQCIVAEPVKDGLVFSLLDPLQGRGRRLAETEPLHDNSEGWSLSADSRKLSWVAQTNASRIVTLDIQSGAKSAFELKGWQVVGLSWAPDNEHFYVWGLLGSKSSISLVGSDARIRDIVPSASPLGGPGMPQPSPDGRSLAFEWHSYDANVVMLENF